MKKIKILLLPLLLFPAVIMIAQEASQVNFEPPKNKKSEYTITNMEQLNSNQLDFCAVSYQDGLVFTSTKGQGGIFACNEDIANGNYSDLYFATKDLEGNYFNPTLLQGDINGKYHDGTATFTPDGLQMIFSRNNKKGVNKLGNIDLKIYSATLEKGAWKNVKELPFNSDNYASCHPSLSFDGNILYFSSNRPGGYGGMDIYKSVKTSEGWTGPINLGPEVNSNGQEIFPFIDVKGNLFYASDGHKGKGGLDIFQVRQVGNNWANRRNLDKPINSRKDDFGYFSNKEGTEGFLTSNRPGGKGKDDIYQWEFIGKQPYFVTICVIDKNTDLRIEDADLAVNTEQSNGKSCNYTQAVYEGENYTIVVNKDGYEPVTLQLDANDLIETDEYLVPISQISKPIPLNVLVLNKNDESPIPLAMVRLKNKCTGEQSETIVDHRGEMELELDCNCEYDIVGLKADYEYDLGKITKEETNCSAGRGVAKILRLLPQEVADPTPEVVSEKFKVGSVIRLENVLYDYNKFNIRPDAATELDKVVELLKKYPTMELELSSHTDARGSDSYNETLSQNRATAAVKYIISQGVASHRVVAKGYGEYQLTNRCKNGVKCSDAEHQENRRTEIKVTKFKEEGVRVINNDE